MGVRNNLSFFLEYIKINLSMAMEYRFNFIIQSLFMIFNDLIFILFWYFFFARFKELNGWVMKDAFLLFGFAALTFGLSSVFFGNWRKLNEIISEGKLDFYLSLPKNELFHVLISKTFFHSWGDLVFGLSIIIALIDYSFTSLLTAATTIITGTILTIAFSIIINSIAFFLGSAKNASDMGFQILLAFSSYPLNIFDGFMRFLLFFVIPLGFITTIPLELLREFDLKIYLTLIVVTIIVSLIAYGIFKLGLKRYESGNTINVQI